ncbi:hypothetical protein HK097_008847 [Rhizophlyctis rosea]|uniref:DUF3669 domain-containing protein n=1 Tax=Rhizophlyctis rosea TaxID=64517 RepID=A0AAD5SBW8_9FUNG|nr:hypothetical protein HK097_008847 [Rhizophlyctis rosea]
MRRIFPVPPGIAKQVKDYFPEQFKTVGQDFLCRIYFGKEQSASTAPKQFFNANNFPLYPDRVRRLGFSVDALARSMGKILGRMVHNGGLDPRDVEFVMGASDNDPLGAPDLFVIDFNQVTPHKGSMEQVARSLIINDPYFPKPHMNGYAAFKDGWLTAARGEQLEDDADKMFKILEAQWGWDSK